jgi:murein DD-endopeptidase MepM/ murein hydrolase activator NlpD
VRGCRQRAIVADDNAAMSCPRHIVPLSVLLLLPQQGDVAACDMPAAADRNYRLTIGKPVHGEDVRLVSGFGLRRHPILGKIKMHTGIDWSAARGTPIVAAAAGRVTFAGVKLEYGRTVVIDHGGGLHTLYAHLADVSIVAGDCVANGAKIGGAGATGLASATGVHFEVRRDGRAIDPQREVTTGGK